ncbi:CPBP family intramembrane glutamic endopeptidase [Natrinema gelatinilyticum]|uniref:CPBP family intramembrane glutamic endopeptidase n=1 Tax=Natrinema gelatinilyticum TaxID=2961571 RepID=UPI0030F3CCB8
MTVLIAVDVGVWLVAILLIVVTRGGLGYDDQLVAAFGEEFGWRGLLFLKRSPLGFWRVSLLTGVVWGLWHAPLIVQGYNSPDARTSVSS